MSIIPSGMTRQIARQVLAAKQTSPRTFFIMGAVGVVGGTILASRATLRLNETLDGAHENIDKTKALVPVTEVDERSRQKAVALAYCDGAYRVAKLYAPAVLVTGASLAALTGSHVMLSRRNAALGAAYGAILKATDDYRDRVREEVGEEREGELYHAIEWQDVPGSDGKIQEPVGDPGKFSPYTRFFDPSNPNWTHDHATNRNFVECVQRFSNHALYSRGYVFLNDVMKDLGLPLSSEGQLVGWWLDPEGEGEGDNYIDFGVYEAVNASHRGDGAKQIMLDFNVDGVMYAKIDRPKA